MVDEAIMIGIKFVCSGANYRYSFIFSILGIPCFSSAIKSFHVKTSNASGVKKHAIQRIHVPFCRFLYHFTRVILHDSMKRIVYAVEADVV